MLILASAHSPGTLWTYDSGGSVNTVPAIVDGTLYWGSGYGTVGLGLKSNNVPYAFGGDAQGEAPVLDAGVDAATVMDSGMPACLPSAKARAGATSTARTSASRRSVTARTVISR